LGRPWRIEIGDGAVRVVVPAFQEPWRVPLSEVAAISGGAGSIGEGLILGRGVDVVPLKTHGFKSYNLTVVFERPVPLPRRRLGWSTELGTSRKTDERADAFMVAAADLDQARATFESAGVPWIPNPGDALVNAVGAVPAAQVSEAQRRRLHRQELVLRVLQVLCWVAYVAVIMGYWATSEHGAPPWLFGLLAVSVGLTLGTRVLGRRYRREGAAGSA
jgi:hypothetical protein